MKKSLILFVVLTLIFTSITACSKEVVQSDAKDDFGFILEYGITGAKGKNVLNTYEGTFEKDTVEGQVKTSLKLSQEDIKEIYDMMKELDLFEYPTGFERRREIEPNGYWDLKVTIDGKEKTIYWTSKAFPANALELSQKAEESGKSKIEYLIENGEDEKLVKLYKIHKLVNIITDKLKNYDEYKKLPQSNMYL